MFYHVYDFSFDDFVGGRWCYLYCGAYCQEKKGALG
jgi:hypothetical protein